MRKCIQLDRVPLVVSEWQQEVHQPDCKFYGNRCECHNPKEKCPFEGKDLPLKEVDERAVAAKG